MKQTLTRYVLTAFAVATLVEATMPSLLAQCRGPGLGIGGGTIVAPGRNKQSYSPFTIDVTGYERGTLIIDIKLDSGPSAASFDLFPEGARLPTEGNPIGILLPGLYDVQPGRLVTMVYPFSRPARYILAATGNWGSQAGAMNSFSYAAHVENGTPRVAPPSPASSDRPITPVTGTAARYCCSLGQVTLSGGGALDPSNLAGHRYGSEGFITPFGEPMGYIYTTNAGLLDMGHVRDLADRTRAIYTYLTGTRADFSLSGSQISVPFVPTDPTRRLDLASSIAYVDGWVHELETWETFKQDFSSFSPEDLVSNMVGIELGRRVITADAYRTDDEFNLCVDTTLRGLMRELNAQPQAQTSTVLRAIQGEGNWYVEYRVPVRDPRAIIPTQTSIYTSFEALRRRNFNGTPWFAWLPRDPLPLVPQWLTPEKFKANYGQFVYIMREPVKGTKVRAMTLPGANVSMQIQAPARRFLSCDTINDFPPTAIIQLMNASGASSPGQVTCAEDETGRRTLVTLQTATNALRIAWVEQHRGMAECGFARRATDVTTDILQSVGLVAASPVCR